MVEFLPIVMNIKSYFEKFVNRDRFTITGNQGVISARDGIAKGQFRYENHVVSFVFKLVRNDDSTKENE